MPPPMHKVIRPVLRSLLSRDLEGAEALGALEMDEEDLNSFLKNALERRRWIKSDHKISQSLFAVSSEEL